MNFKKTFGILIVLLILLRINVYAYDKSPIDITTMDITELSQALDEGIITSEELVQLYLDRIEAYDDQYNAIITVNEDALAQAKELDEERADGNVRSILHGIPIIVKDNIDVYGLPTTGGSKILSDNYPDANSEVVQELIDAGAIIIAKTNMSKFAFYASSSSSDYGTVKNAYNTSYSSYGSSGGSAVSVAVSFAAAALGTDTNSSIRTPAAANYVVGLRPTLGLVSRTGVLPYDPERDTVGTLTKTVSDSVILMNIINGYDATDSKSINQDKQTYTVTSDSLEGYTIGVPTSFLKGSNSNSLTSNKETYSEIYDMMVSALDKMEDDGATIVYLDDYYTYTQENWVNTSYSGYLFCNAFNDYIGNTSGTITNFYQLAAKVSLISSYDDYCGVSTSLDSKNATKEKYKEYIDNIMDENNLDVIVYPTTKNKLLETGTSEGFMGLSNHAAPTIGYPAISMPLGFDSDGLPYGIEFMAKANEENLLYNITSVYESLNVEETVPSIAPSLYTISDEVKTLVNNYETVYNKDSISTIEKKWLSEVKTYFSGYNDNDEVESDAKTLNEKYEQNKLIVPVVTGSKLILKIIGFGLIGIIIIVAVLILRKVFRKKHRRLKHKA